MLLQMLHRIPAYAYLGCGLLAATTAYVFYTPSASKNRTKSNRKEYPRGLINYRNECFMNVILQALSSSSKVVDWLENLSQLSTSPKSLSNVLHKIISNINRSDDKKVENGTLVAVDESSLSNEMSLSESQSEFYAASKLRNALIQHNWHIGSREHDCHELFHLLMDVLDEEHLKDRQSMKSLNYFTYPNLVNEETTSPFHGYLVSQLQCLDCSYKYPLKLESFYSLSLTLPQYNAFKSSTLHHQFDSNSYTLTECINNYFKLDYIKDMICENCKKPNEDTNGKQQSSQLICKKKGFIKKLAISKMPECLCIHIQRNSWSGSHYQMIKKTNYVQFPLKINIFDQINKNMNEENKQSIGGESTAAATISTILPSPPTTTSNPFSLRQVGIGGLLGGNSNRLLQQSSKNTSTTSPTHHTSSNIHSNLFDYYELSSAIVHYGNAQSGHFIAYRKSLEKNSDKWLEISDNTITTCKLANLLNNNVYMLFYDKIHTQQQKASTTMVPN